MLFGASKLIYAYKQLKLTVLSGLEAFRKRPMPRLLTCVPSGPQMVALGMSSARYGGAVAPVSATNSWLESTFQI